MEPPDIAIKQGDFAILDHRIHDEFLEYHQCFNRLFVVEKVYWNDRDNEWRISLLPTDDKQGLNTNVSSVVVFLR